MQMVRVQVGVGVWVMDQVEVLVGVGIQVGVQVVEVWPSQDLFWGFFCILRIVLQTLGIFLKRTIS